MPRSSAAPAGIFPASPHRRDGSQLQRYAWRLNAAEINSSFYRSTPPPPIKLGRRRSGAFRFTVKVPKLITHDRALTRAREPLTRFLGEIAGLGGNWGRCCPAAAITGVRATRAGGFFGLLRRLHDGRVVCEPRHATWATPVAERMLLAPRIAGWRPTTARRRTRSARRVARNRVLPVARIAASVLLAVADDALDALASASNGCAADVTLVHLRQHRIRLCGVNALDLARDLRPQSPPGWARQIPVGQTPSPVETDRAPRRERLRAS